MKKGLLAPLLFVLCAGCSAKSGELMTAVDSDMSIPKDVDKIRFLVTEDGATKYDVTRDVGPTQQRLPGTLGFYDSVNEGSLLTMRVIAYQGGTPRVVAKAVSSVPEDRTATIRLPINWLCDGAVAAKPPSNPLDPPDIDTNCPDGQSCVAGSCVDDAADSATLPDYTPAAIFGGGSGDGDGNCFDVQACFAGITDATVDMTTCTFKPASTDKLNISLRTEGDGICGPNGCLIALDKDDKSGWKVDGDGTVTLPMGACTKLMMGTAGAVGVANACETKTGSTPVCGPWSAAGSSNTGETKGAQTLSAAQDHPLALFIDDNNVSWINGGTFGKSNGSFKQDPLAGGVPKALATMLPTPQQAFVFNSGTTAETVYFSNNGPTGMTDGSILSFQPNKSGATPETLASGLDSPVGVAVLGTDVYFTSFGKQNLNVISLGNTTEVANSLTNPIQVVPNFEKTKVYVVEEGTLGMADGHIHLFDPGDIGSPVSIPASTPHAMAADADNIYWIEFSATDGAVKSNAADLSGSPTTLASSQNFPSSIALDATNVYWTNLGDGTVWSVKKTGGTPTLLASGQYKPAGITVFKGKVYWVNQGASDSADGSIVVLDPSSSN